MSQSNYVGVNIPSISQTFGGSASASWRDDFHLRAAADASRPPAILSWRPHQSSFSPIPKEQAQRQSLPKLWDVVGPKENLIARPKEPERAVTPPKLRVPLSPAPASRANQAIRAAPIVDLTHSRKRKSDDFREVSNWVNDPYSNPWMPAEREVSRLPPAKRYKKIDTGARSVASTSRTVTGQDPLDVSGIRLAGEEKDGVEVFDTCDTVRRKIRAFLRNSGITQAAFLRALAQTFSDGRKLQGAQLNRFLSLSGPTAGNTSGIFYAAYVFFEKVRIRDGKPKSTDRLEMERIHPSGMNTTEIRNYFLTIHKDEQMVEDKFGRIKFI
ncbi:hypothetical protein UCRPA7_4719 [Phaeoacremonium minimum UCRPA7]|uniref:DUF7726 domain-containing protein n=1 Tax=Phaeoacremonium minimum (strain UCR-PA7) TaxID=1286976 RepID=R8BKL7_PHAM7|nr:hypothetical protein UCRPA7_4719 [Phaeoacremonium minimum UCRPA7]EON99865.1 hypothetical protein UCRPA7_4719 [Phaeoacremonium minimum UCRPA7]